MKKANSIDYGIYIDRQKAFIVSLSHLVHEMFLNEATEMNEEIAPDGARINEQEHLQEKKKVNFKKFCKSITEQIVNANNIVVFGPSAHKYDLQNTILGNKRLKNVNVEVMTTDNMNKDAAIRQVKNFYTPITVGQQIFVGKKRKP